MESEEDILNEAIKSFNEGNYDTSVKNYSKFLELHPESKEAFYNKGIALQKLSRYKESLECFSKSFDLDSNFIPALLGKALSLSLLNEKEKAIEIYEQIISLEGKNLDAYINKATNLLDLGKFEEAENCIKKLENILENEDIENKEEIIDNIKFIKANIFQQKGEYNKSIELYNELLEKNNEDEKVLINKGICLLKLNNLGEANNCFDIILQKNKKIIQAIEGKAYILLEQKNYSEALKYYEEAIQLNPDNNNNFIGKTQCLENLGKKEEVLRSINNIKGTNKIEFLIKNDRIEEAENIIDESLQKNENDLKMNFLKGYILCKNDEADNAKEIFDKILEKDKNNYLALYNCGLVLLNNNRYDEAKEYMIKCLEIDPEFDKAKICLANIYINEKSYDEAIKYYDQILEKENNNEMCLFNKAYSLYMKQNYSESLKLYEEIIKNNNENLQAKMGLGLCYYQLKEYDKAIEQFDLILEKEPQNFDCLYNKAICLYSKNNKEDKDDCNEILKNINKKIKKPFISLSQGIIYLKEKKYNSGIKKFVDALSKEEDNIYAHHGRGQCLYEKGNLEEAIQSYDEALKINPDYSNALNSKANALDKLDKKEALKIYQKLNEVKPENAIYKLNYAICLYETDDFEKSEIIFAEAEKLFEVQKNNFDEDVIKIFEKNVSKLKKELNNKKSMK